LGSKERVRSPQSPLATRSTQESQWLQITASEAGLCDRLDLRRDEGTVEIKTAGGRPAIRATSCSACAWRPGLRNRTWCRRVMLPRVTLQRLPASAFRNRLHSDAGNQDKVLRCGQRQSRGPVTPGNVMYTRGRRVRDDPESKRCASHSGPACGKGKA